MVELMCVATKVGFYVEMEMMFFCTAQPYDKNVCRFTCKKYDMIMRDGVVEGSGSLDHLVFNAHWYGMVYGSLKFRLHRNATAAAGIEPTTLGSAAEHRNHCTTEADSEAVFR